MSVINQPGRYIMSAVGSRSVSVWFRRSEKDVGLLKDDELECLTQKLQVYKCHVL